MMKRLLQPTGSAMIQILIAATAAIGLVTFMFQNQGQQEKLLLLSKAKKEKSVFIREITEALADHDACVASLAAAGPLGNGMQIPAIRGKNGNTMYQVGSIIGEQRISKIELKSFGPSNGLRYNASQIHLTLSSVKEGPKAGYGGRDTVSTIPLFLVTNNNVATICMSDPTGSIKDAFRSACEEFTLNQDGTQNGFFNEDLGVCTGIFGPDGVVTKHVKKYLCNASGVACEHPFANQVCTGTDPRGVNFNNWFLKGFTDSGELSCNCRPARICPNPATICLGGDTGTDGCNNCPGPGTMNCPSAWDIGDWGDCSSSCNGGSRTRTVVCRNSVGTQVDPSNCPAPAPVTTESCNGGIPCFYAWQAGNFGSCSASCGPGQEVRTVQCLDDSNLLVADSFCDPALRPVDTRDCNGLSCGTRWDVGIYGACSVPCGNGVQTRTVVCRDNATESILDDSACFPEPKPETQTPCPGSQCGYSWVEGGFGDCSVTCGTGEKTQNVFCRDNSTGSPVSNGLCTEARPPSSMACQGTDCGFTWLEGDWGACSIQCGSGFRDRVITCRRNFDNQTVDNNQCTPPGPLAREACSGTDCGYSWQSSEWSQCTPNCGVSRSKSRTVTCINNLDNSTVDPALCNGNPRPSETATCDAAPCPCVFTPEPWSGADPAATAIRCRPAPGELTIQEGRELDIGGGQRFNFGNQEGTDPGPQLETFGTATYKCENGQPVLLRKTCTANCIVRTLNHYFPAGRQRPQQCMTDTRNDGIYSIAGMTDFVRVEHNTSEQLMAPNDSFVQPSCNNGDVNWDVYECNPLGQDERPD